MIIELDDAFIAVDLGSSPAYLRGIESILLSIARGEHYLKLSRALLSALIENPLIGEAGKGVLNSIKSEYASLNGLLNVLQYRIRILASSTPPRRVTDKVWEVPITHIAAYGIRPTILLGENSNDAEIYLFAAKHYRVESKLNLVQIVVEPRNGNGSSVSEELERLASRTREFCLCITDSDRFSPNCGNGAIAAACSSVVSNSNWVVRHETPTNRELENALPATLIEDAISKMLSTQWASFSAAIGALGLDAFNHCDIKDGTCAHWIRSLPSGSPASNFWNSLQQSAILKGLLKPCATSCNCKNSCTCIVVPRVANNVASHVYDYLGRESPNATHKRASTSHNFNDWIRIGKEVFEAGAAPKPMRV